jgi:hypothetical protein
MQPRLPRPITDVCGLRYLWRVAYNPVGPVDAPECPVCPKEQSTVHEPSQWADPGGNLILRQQINVLRRRIPKRPDLNNTDRFLFIWLYRWFPSLLSAVAIVRWGHLKMREFMS